MSKRARTLLIKYGSCCLLIGLLAWFKLGTSDFSSAALVDKYRLLSDAFSIPGLLLVMFGALVWASNEGALLGIAYIVRFTVFSLIPGKRLQREEKYADYVERKTSKKTEGYGFLFFSGLASLTVGIVFLALFYTVY